MPRPWAAHRLAVFFFDVSMGYCGVSEGRPASPVLRPMGANGSRMCRPMVIRGLSIGRLGVARGLSVGRPWIAAEMLMTFPKQDVIKRL